MAKLEPRSNVKVMFATVGPGVKRHAALLNSYEVAWPKKLKKEKSSKQQAASSKLDSLS